MLHWQSVFSRNSAGTDLLRLVLCAIISVHGWYRLYEGTLPEMGALLSDFGFPFGLAFAYAMNAMEMFGTILLALRILVWPMGLGFIVIYFTGIVMFHARSGFFVVGPGENGWEYSALLITCFIVVMWGERDHPWAIRSVRYNRV